MAPVVRGDNQQPRADRKAKESNERVAKPNAVQVKLCSISNHRSHILVRTKKTLQSVLAADLRSWNNFPGCAQLSFWRRFEGTNDKPAEPTWLNWPAAGSLRRSGFL